MNGKFSRLKYLVLLTLASGLAAARAGDAQRIEIIGRAIRPNPDALSAGDFIIPGPTAGALPFKPLPPPAPNNSSTARPDNPVTCNPVVVATGEKVLEQTDFEWPSVIPLTLKRTLRGQVGGGVMFGNFWTSNFDWPALIVTEICFGAFCQDLLRLTMRLPGGEIRYFTDRRTTIRLPSRARRRASRTPAASR